MKPVRHIFKERFSSYTARIRFGHPKGVTSASRTRLRCKDISQTELSKNWLNNFINPQFIFPQWT